MESPEHTYISALPKCLWGLLIVSFWIFVLWTHWRFKKPGATFSPKNILQVALLGLVIALTCAPMFLVGNMAALVVPASLFLFRYAVNPDLRPYFWLHLDVRIAISSILHAWLYVGLVAFLWSAWRIHKRRHAPAVSD